jgi:hypothetical protein
MRTCSDGHNHQVRIFDIGFSIALGCLADIIRDAYMLEVISFQTSGDCRAVEHARRDCHAGEGDRARGSAGPGPRMHGRAREVPGGSWERERVPKCQAGLGASDTKSPVHGIVLDVLVVEIEIEKACYIKKP